MNAPEHREFPLKEEICYLNHAAVSPWPRRSIEAIERFARENMHLGSLHYPQWLEVEQQLREQLARLIQAPSSETIALVKNTSEALSLVATGLDWQNGDNIVISDQEFPSNRIVWESLRDQGVEIKSISLNGDNPEQNLIQALDERTRLLSISSLQYGTGLRMDLQQLGKACRAREVLFCVDAIQSVGAYPVDVQACAIDFLAADGHKWMLGPEGLGLFYVASQHMDTLKLQQFGWHMVEHVGDYDRRQWQPAHSARRFEPGSPNMLGIHALQASTSLLLEEGLERVEKQILQHTRFLMDALQEALDAQWINPQQDDRRAGIISFTVADADHQQLHQKLCQQGVFCAYRAGGIRLSPHFYTPQSVLERAVQIIIDTVNNKAT